MKATLLQLREAQPCLTMLLNARMPAKAAWAVSRLSAAVSAELERAARPDDEVDDSAREVELNAAPLQLEHFGNVDVPGAAFFALDWAIAEPR